MVAEVIPNGDVVRCVRRLLNESPDRSAADVVAVVQKCSAELEAAGVREGLSIALETMARRRLAG